MAYYILPLRRKLVTQPEFWGHQGTAVIKAVNTTLSCEKIAFWSRLAVFHVLLVGNGRRALFP